MAKRRHLMGTQAAWITIDNACLACNGTGLYLTTSKEAAYVKICQCVQVHTGFKPAAVTSGD